jgi:MFS family permease
LNRSAEPAKADPGKLGLALAALAGAQLITALDFNIVYVALPEIGSQLGFSGQSRQWVFSAYSVLFGGFLLLGGRAADLYGRRRIFVAGLSLYAIASVIGGFATSAFAMIASRGMQGIGGALLFPSTVALINTLFEEGPARNRALGLWSLAGSSGLTLGSLVGGLLVSTLGWQWVFFVNLPIALLVGTMALVAIASDPPAARAGKLDLPGAVVSTTGVMLLVLSLVEASEWGWTAALTGAFAAALLLGAFVLIEARTSHPLMPLAMFRRGSLAPAMAVTFMFMGTFMALPYFTTELFQRAFAFTPLQTGLAFLVPCLAIAAGTQIGSRLAAKVGARLLLSLGLLVGAVGAAIVAAAIGPSEGYAALVPGLLVFGLGQGVAWPAMWIAATSGIPAEEQGIASGMASTTLWIGGATGLSLLVVVSGAPAGDPVVQTIPDLIDSSRHAIFAIAAGIVLTLPIALFTSGGLRNEVLIVPH